MPADNSDATWFIHGRVSGDVMTTGLLGVGELLAFGHEQGEPVVWSFGYQSEVPYDLADGVEATCALVMDQVQDGVIDRLGRPWPELVDAGGTFVGVLEPAVASGLACWALRGVPFCAVGQLSAAVPANGFRLA